MKPAPSGTHPAELVPLAEGARRLGLAHDTARKHLSAGTLRGEKRQGRWWVWTPMPDDMPDASGTNPAPSGTMPDAVIARLESENAHLRQILDAEIEARRRADHLVAALMDRIPALPTGELPQDMPQDAIQAPGRDVPPAQLADSPIARLRRFMDRAAR